MDLRDAFDVKITARITVSNDLLYPRESLNDDSFLNISHPSFER